MKTCSAFVASFVALLTTVVVGCAGASAEETTGDTAQELGTEPLFITDQNCGSAREVSSIEFQNVGNEDTGEGAPTFIKLRLCQSRPGFRGYELTTGSCWGDKSGSVAFRNVGREDDGEGAPSHIEISLCSDDGWDSRYVLSSDGSCRGSAVTFRNVGREDEGEGAPTFVTVALCRRWH